MRMLDQRHREAARGEKRNQPLDERRLAAAGPARKSEDLHAGLNSSSASHPASWSRLFLTAFPPDPCTTFIGRHEVYAVAPQGNYDIGTALYAVTLPQV